MLVFLAGMVGFALPATSPTFSCGSELMSVAGFALTAYRPEERGPLQGALNFAITNSVAPTRPWGIALIYARTGALNMRPPDGGCRLGHGRPSGLVIVAFVLIIMGFLTKGAVVPFHFWLADAHAVARFRYASSSRGSWSSLGFTRWFASTPVSFRKRAGPPRHITTVFLALGTLTAVVGALYCFRQRHLKRLLAFSTVSHAGLFLIGFALLSPLGLTGTAVYVIGHGLVKAALFLCVGIVLHRLGSVDETALHGRGRSLRITGVIFVSPVWV